jgi:heme/copper-type cytochrome/quinol oxidase subunit 4
MKRISKIRMRLAAVSKSTWVYVVVIAALIAVAVACLFVWMHLSGYSLEKWLGRYWPICAMVLLAIVVGALFAAYMKMRARK